MSKWLSVVALVLLVLSGAIGLRNSVAASSATLSGSGISALAVWRVGPGPFPPIPPAGGKH
jgi:hypothetical protein